MRKLQGRWKMLVSAGAAVFLAAGLVQAQPTPDTAPQPLPAPPPAPAPTPVIMPPAEPVPSIAPPPVESAPKASRKAAEEAPKSEPVAAQPQVRERHGAAVIQALDKVTAETMRFEARVGQPVRYKDLVFTVRACETTAADEPMPDSLAYVEVRDEPRSPQSDDQVSHQVFNGWMFASSPALRPLQHPVYDAWLIACKA